MHEVGEGIYRLGTAIHNFYVIAEGGKATVVDAGCSKELPKLEQGLGSISMTLDDVEAIILTTPIPTTSALPPRPTPPAPKSGSVRSKDRLLAAIR